MVNQLILISLLSHKFKLIISFTNLFRMGGTEFNELEFIVMFIPVSKFNQREQFSIYIFIVMQ